MHSSPVEKPSKKESFSNARHKKIHTHSRVKGPTPVDTSPSEADLRQDFTDAAQSERVGLPQEEGGVSTYGNEGGGIFHDWIKKLEDRIQEQERRLDEIERRMDEFECRMDELERRMS